MRMRMRMRMRMHPRMRRHSPSGPPKGLISASVRTGLRLLILEVLTKLPVQSYTIYPKGDVPSKCIPSAADFLPPRIWGYRSRWIYSDPSRCRLLRPPR